MLPLSRALPCIVLHPLRQAVGQAHGLAQVPHLARAAHLRQVQGCIAQGHAGAEGAVKGIDQQVQIGGRCGGLAGVTRTAIAAGVSALGGLHIAIAQVHQLAGTFDADGDNAAFWKGLEFVLLAHTVLVEVTPDAQAGKYRILAVDQFIAIAVKFGQRVKAILGFAAIALDGVHAKELGAGVYAAVGIEVAHQPTVVGLDPASAGFDAVAVVVKGHHRV